MKKDFLEYSRETNINVIKEEGFHQLISETFGIVAETLSQSLGPMGSTTTIMNGQITSATKDGFAILKSMEFNNRFKALAMNLIRTPCVTLNNTVGDGTTTAITMANELYQLHHVPYDYSKIEMDENGNPKPYLSKLQYINRKHRLPRELTNAWDEIVSKMQEKIKKHSTPLDTSSYDAVYNLCHVTSNGNHEVSDTIAKIYNKCPSPHIMCKDSPELVSYVKEINGFNIRTNLIDSRFASNEDLSHVQENMKVMIFDYKVTSDVFNKIIMPIQKVLQARSEPLLIIAPMYDDVALNAMMEYIATMSRNGKGVTLFLSQYIKLRDNQLYDLSVICNTFIITQGVGSTLITEIESIENEGLFGEFVEKQCVFDYNSTPNHVGEVKEVNLVCDGESIFRVDDLSNNKRYNDTIADAEHALESARGNIDHSQQIYSHNLYEHRERIARLKMQNFIYYVGAPTALEQNILKDSVDDVIKCISSASRFGIVPGGQLSIMRAANEVSIDLLMPYINDVNANASDIRYNEIMNILDQSKLSDNTPDEVWLKTFLCDMIYKSACTVYLKALNGPKGIGLIRLIPGWDQLSGDDASLEKVREFKDKIISESLDKYCTFDMSTADFSNRIITSAETDIQVLSTAIQLIKILISGNQCLFIDSQMETTETIDDYLYNR